ncbi:MAG: sporulation peptidase YabG [Bacilli bacterium]
MLFKVGDYVTRNSYNNDTLFKITEIKDNIAILKGVNVRLLADSDLSDLKKCPEEEIKFDDDVVDDDAGEQLDTDRDDFFYIPGLVLHIDGDVDYLKRSMKLYKRFKLLAYGVVLKEEMIADCIRKCLTKIQPDIIVITGHDAHYKRGENDNLYKNSANFVKSIIEARKYEKAHDKLIIIAGACQSNYKELIKAGANFASSPGGVNIHALDPAIVATNISLTEKNETIDLMGILLKTKYGKEGMGGIKTKGTMYIGYPK